MKVLLRAVLPLLLLLAVPAFASPVSLGVSGTLLGETPVAVGSQLGQQFTLDSTTLVTSAQIVLDPPSAFGGFLGSLWSLSIVSGGQTYWTSGATSSIFALTSPITLGPGTYTYLVSGLGCSGPCIGPNAVSLDYYRPATYTGTGGSVGSVVGLNDGALGFSLQGETVPSPVPEPGSILLIGTGMFALFAARKFPAGSIYRRMPVGS